MMVKKEFVQLFIIFKLLIDSLENLPNYSKNFAYFFTIVLVFR